MSIKLRISITKEVLEATKDCVSSKPSLVENCAIAFAVREIWPKAETYYSLIYPFGLFYREELKVGHDQNDFIIAFDSATPAERAAMQPVSFEIEVPDSVINEINIEEIRRICEGSKTLELVKI